MARFLLLLSLALLTIAPAKPKAVAVQVLYGTVLPHKGTVTLRVTVEPNSANRGLWVAIEASGYAAASYEQLNKDSRRTREVQFKDLPDGNYTAWVRLLRVKGETSDSATFIVGQDEELFP